MVWVSKGKKREGAARGAGHGPLAPTRAVQGSQAATDSSRAVPRSVKPYPVPSRGRRHPRQPGSREPEPSVPRPGAVAAGPVRAGGRCSGRPGGAELSWAHCRGGGGSARESPAPCRPPRRRGKARSRRDSRPDSGEARARGTGSRWRARPARGIKSRPRGEQERGSLLNRFLRSNDGRGEGLDWKRVMPGRISFKILIKVLCGVLRVLK